MVTVGGATAVMAVLGFNYLQPRASGSSTSSCCWPSPAWSSCSPPTTATPARCWRGCSSSCCSRSSVSSPTSSSGATTGATPRSAGPCYARTQQLRAASLTPVEEANAAFTAAAVAATTGTAAHRVQSTARREEGSAVLPSDTVDIYTAGSQKFPALLAEMATAEKYIHLMYLIWEQDELTAKVTEVLLERMKAGVEVHIIYDWLSCISYKKDELKKLAAAGATVVPCYKRLPQINYRNHMKMVIIDGKSVYSRRDEHGPGVHRRGAALRRVARHVVPAQRAGGDPLPAPLRGHLDPERRQGGPRHRLPASGGVARARRGHARAGAALQRGHHVQGHPRRVHHGAAGRPRAHLDPVAVLRPGRAADHGDVRGGGQRHRRALHDDRHAGQEDPLLRRPRLLPAAAALAA